MGLGAMKEKNIEQGEVGVKKQENKAVSSSERSKREVVHAVTNSHHD